MVYSTIGTQEQSKNGFFYFDDLLQNKPTRFFKVASVS